MLGTNFSNSKATDKKIRSVLLKPSERSNATAADFAMVIMKALEFLKKKNQRNVFKNKIKFLKKN